MRLQHISLALAVSVIVGCSGDSAVDPNGRSAGVPPATPRTLTLTSVSGKRLPAVYFTGAGGDSWADSGTVTIQPDGIVAIRLYESATYPSGGVHVNQPSQRFFASGQVSGESTLFIKYFNSPTPDVGTINHDGSIAVNFNGTADGRSVSFGTWLFSGQYQGPPLNPAPLVTDVTPGSVPQYSADATLQITGLSFMPVITAAWSGTQLPVAYSSPAQINVTIPTRLLARSGQYQIVLTNPGPGGGTYYFPYRVVSAAPVITSLSPNTVRAGSSLLQLAVQGTGFSDSSVVTWNGVARRTTFGSQTTLYVTLQDADLASAGVAQVAVMTPAPGGGTSASLPFTVTGVAPRVISQISVRMAVHAIAADPARPVVYAGLDATDPVHPNSIVALDGATGQVLWAVPVTGTPKVLTVSDDGQFLYVGKVTEPTITRIALATHAVDLTIPLGAGPLGPYRASGIYVSPGRPHTIVVPRECVCAAPYPYTDVGVTVYDDAVARPVSSVNQGNIPPVLTYGASPSTVYGFVGATFYEIAIDASGATNKTVLRDPAVNGSIGPEVLYLGGKLYTTSGYIYDPVTNKSLPPFPSFLVFPFTMAASRDGHTLYRISGGSTTLQAYDLDQGTLAGAIPISGLMNRTSNLVRWGADGLAFISGDLINSGEAVFLVRADFVH